MQIQVSLPTAELDSLLSAADALQLSLLRGQPTAANENVSNPVQSRSTIGNVGKELEMEVKKIEKGITINKQIGTQLANPKTGLGTSSTLDKFIKSNRISRVQRNPTADVNDSAQENKKASCTECGKEFAAFNHLWVHIQSIHHSRYQCKNCGKTYSNASILNQHMDSAHNGIHLVCQDCGKKFSFQQSFDRHIRKKHFSSD